MQLVVYNPLDSLTANVRGCENVLDAVARHGSRGLYASTSEIYGKASSGALAEDADRILGSPFKSRWNYAIAKGFGECLAHGLHVDRGARIATARLFNTVGARQTGRYGMVLPALVRQALEGHDLTVFGTGEQTRCFTHVADTVAALVALLDAEAASGDVFNVGSPTETPILELARLVLERTGSDSAIRLVAYEHAYGDGFEELGRRKPDTSKLRALTGWSPARTLAEAIDDVVRWERARPARESAGLVGS